MVDGSVGALVGPVGGMGVGADSETAGGVAGAVDGGAGGGETGGPGFGLVATADGSVSPVKGASQSATCSGSMAR